jgi:hypothetical protein
MGPERNVYERKQHTKQTERQPIIVVDLIHRISRWLNWYQVRVSKRTALKNCLLNLLLILCSKLFNRDIDILVWCWGKNHEEPIREIWKWIYKMFVVTALLALTRRNHARFWSFRHISNISALIFFSASKIHLEEVNSFNSNPLCSSFFRSRARASTLLLKKVRAPRTLNAKYV